jgi:iron complex transport system substrate-binding protein
MRAVFCCVAGLIALSAGGCGRERAASAPSMAPVVLVDDQSDTVRLTRPATRVISLIPSANETLIALGAANRIVGRTRYDVDTAIIGKPLIGSGLAPNLETILSLRPDLVIVWASDKRRDVQAQLIRAGVATLALTLQDTTDAYRALTLLGDAVGERGRATMLTDSIRRTLTATRASIAGAKAPRVFYVVFNDPPMTTGPNTFIAQILAVAGGDNVFADAVTNWPTIPMEELVRRDPDVIVLPVGEMPDSAVTRLHVLPGWRDLRAVREGRIVRIDANLSSRPGPNMGRAAVTLRDLLHPAQAAK